VKLFSFFQDSGLDLLESKKCIFFQARLCEGTSSDWLALLGKALPMAIFFSEPSLYIFGTAQFNLIKVWLVESKEEREGKLCNWNGGIQCHKLFPGE
jgi:hypothetical protein